MKTSQFLPPSYLRNPHLQTLAAYFLRPKRVPNRYRIVADTPDGDQLLLESFKEPTQISNGQSFVLILHGLEGCSRSSYVLETARLLKNEDLIPIAMNFRSCGGFLNQRKRTYHAGDTEDLSFVLNWLQDQFQPEQIGIIGFSLGGNVLLKYLGEREENISKNVVSAAVVSVPFDLKRGAKSLSSGFSRVYDLHFLSLLKRTIRTKNRKQEHDYDIKKLCDSNTIYEFDEYLTAPIHGFDDAEDYYQQASCIPYLKRIRIPTLIIHSRDDPMIPSDSIPREELANNDKLDPVITNYGGHVGFVNHEEDLNFSFWAEESTTNYICSNMRNEP